jgi:hypothetical protein
MNFRNYPKIAFILLWTITIKMSCLSDAQDVMPKFNQDIVKMTNDITAQISCEQVRVSGTKSQETSERTLKNLDIQITDAKIKFFNQQNLDSLSENIFSIAKKNISNISSYDWVNVLYLTSDGSQPSDSATKTTYVRRPEEIK